MDTVILKVKSPLAQGGYILEIDTMNIDKTKLQVSYNPDRKEYEGSTAVIYHYPIIPLDTGNCYLTAIYKRPWENTPLKTCTLEFQIIKE